MSVASQRIDWAIFVALGFMWGSSYLFIKIGVAELPTFTLVALRLLVGAALLWTVVTIARKQLPRSLRTYGHLVVMGAVNIAIPFALITWAEQSVDSGLAAIITGIVPLFTAIFAPIFIPDEPLRANAVAGLVIGFAGVLVLTGGVGGAPTDLVAATALILSSVAYAAGAVYARRNVRGLDPMIPAVFQVTFALAMTAVVALALERPWEVRPGTASILSVLWLGVLGSGLAYLAVFRLLKRWGATRTTAVAYLIPIFGVALGAVVLAEPIGARTIVGTALVLGGIGLVNARYGRRVLFSRGASRAPNTVGLPGT